MTFPDVTVNALKTGLCELFQEVAKIFNFLNNKQPLKFCVSHVTEKL